MPWPSLGLAARQLAPVANRPVLFHHLDTLAHAGVREVAIVTDSTTRTSIRHAVGDGSEWGLELTHVADDGGRNVLASGAISEFVGGNAVQVHHGDILLRESLSALEGDFAEQDLDALILRSCAGSAPAKASAGYIIGPDVHLALRRQSATLDDALRRLSAAGARIGEREVDVCMPCRGGADGLLAANRRVLEQLEPRHHGERIFESELQGVVDLHPSAEVRASVVRGPVTIGANTHISNSYIGPYTSIGAGARLDCVEIEHSIVLDEARIEFLESRVEGSLIGPRANVTRDFFPPRAIRVSIGEGARVSFG
jgi:glucose-1-phosphate thymidylyltransferase